MRLIDADELLLKLDVLTELMPVDDDWRYDPNRDSKWDGYFQSNLDAMKLVEKEPTVDAVPVVRCKDCKYYDDDFHECSSSAFPDWFCADGERRKDDD